jgi:hypothetical protein
MLWNTNPIPQKWPILQAGFHKSGIMALQESFFAQRKVLETQGVLYPSLGWQALGLPAPAPTIWSHFLAPAKVEGSSNHIGDFFSRSSNAKALLACRFS